MEQSHDALKRRIQQPPQRGTEKSPSLVQKQPDGSRVEAKYDTPNLSYETWFLRSLQDSMNHVYVNRRLSPGSVILSSQSPLRVIELLGWTFTCNGSTHDVGRHHGEGYCSTALSDERICARP